MNGKGLIAGIAAGIVFTLINFIFSMVPGTSEWYASVFPQLVSPAGMWAMTASTFMVGFFMGIVYSVVSSGIPGKGARKGLNYGFMVWLVAGLMWPIMMMGFASAYMWVTQLISGFVTYVITGLVIAVIYKKPE